MIDGVDIDAQIKLLSAGSYQVFVEATGATIQTSSSPLPVVLTIGNDGGSATK